MAVVASGGGSNHAPPIPQGAVCSPPFAVLGARLCCQSTTAYTKPTAATTVAYAAFYIRRSTYAILGALLLPLINRQQQHSRVLPMCYYSTALCSVLLVTSQLLRAQAQEAGSESSVSVSRVPSGLFSWGVCRVFFRCCVWCECPLPLFISSYLFFEYLRQASVQVLFKGADLVVVGGGPSTFGAQVKSPCCWQPHTFSPPRL